MRADRSQEWSGLQPDSAADRGTVLASARADEAVAAPGRATNGSVGHGDSSKTSPLELLAYPLMPADEGRGGQVVEASSDWRFDPAAFDDEAAVALWGRLPDSSSSLRAAVLAAGAREAAIRTVRRHVPSHHALVAVHRLPPRSVRTSGLHGRIGAAVRGGALVELASAPRVERVLDCVLGAAQVSRPDSRFHVGTGGSMLVRGTQGSGGVVVRLARAGAPGDPKASADALDSLALERVPLAPRVLARGLTAGAAWTVEATMPGRRPRRATLRLLRQVAAACASFPRGAGAPTATADDLAVVAERLPERASAVVQLSRELAGSLSSLPSMLRHGDLWAGNVLVDDGRLSGLVDWDSAHPEAVPGCDLLQLFATEFRKRVRCALGPAFMRRPWRLPMFADALRSYWPAVEVAPSDGLLDLVGVAWWAGEMRGTLTRVPHRASDERWVTTNVDPVLRELGF